MAAKKLSRLQKYFHLPRPWVWHYKTPCHPIISMINLLPPKEKEALLEDKKKNVTILLSSIVIVALVALIFMLFSLKLYILQEIEAKKTVFDAAQKKVHDPDLLPV